MSEPLYHITDRDTWQQAIRNGHYTTESLEREGFIHCSFRHQVTRVADALYAGEEGLLLIEIHPDNVQSEIRLEGESERFPHIYGPINLSAVTRITPFRTSDDGSFAFPPDFA